MVSTILEGNPDKNL
ncbi:hypothetical protein, partial [Bifidobacterium sp.]